MKSFSFTSILAAQIKFSPLIQDESVQENIYNQFPNFVYGRGDAVLSPILAIILKTMEEEGLDLGKKSDAEVVTPLARKYVEAMFPQFDFNEADPTIKSFINMTQLVVEALTEMGIHNISDVEQFIDMKSTVQQKAQRERNIPSPEEIAHFKKQLNAAIECLKNPQEIESGVFGTYQSRYRAAGKILMNLVTSILQGENRKQGVPEEITDFVTVAGALSRKLSSQDEKKYTDSNIQSGQSKYQWDTQEIRGYIDHVFFEETVGLLARMKRIPDHCVTLDRADRYEEIVRELRAGDSKPEAVLREIALIVAKQKDDEVSLGVHSGDRTFFEEGTIRAKTDRKAPITQG